MGPPNKPLLQLDDFELKAIKINFNLFLNYLKETREGPVPEKKLLPEIEFYQIDLPYGRANI